MLIMLVENNENEMRKLQKCVAGCYPNSDIIPFTNSSAAMEFIKSDRFSVDLCFTVVAMTGITGFGLAEELRKHNKAAKIVFVADSAEYAAEAWQHFASDYLITPITPESVRHTLASCV